MTIVDVINLATTPKTENDVIFYQLTHYHFPPNSRVTGVKCSAAAFMTMRPTVDDPV